MSAAPRPSSPVDVLGDRPVRLEDVVDRAAVDELCASLSRLFGVGLRVYSAEGALVASSPFEQPVCGVVNETADGRRACGAVVDAAKNVDATTTTAATHTCFSGLTYRIVALEYEKRQVGRFVLGPFASADLAQAPPSLRTTLPTIDARAESLLARMPRIKNDALERLAEHAKTSLELVIFSSHRAYLTSKWHLYSVRESYRELEEKTRRLEGALARLTEVDRLKSNFLATVSHELRTPLTSILGYGEMLSDGIAGPLSEEQAEFVTTIRTKGEQLLALITGLLDLSKLESGTMHLRPTSTRIGALLGEVVSTVAPVARKKGIEVSTSDDGVPFDLVADPVRLRQVFTNLVENAVKFTPTGGSVAITARVVEGRDGAETGGALLAPVFRNLEVAVADTGIGIPPLEREKIFDAFYQVDSGSTRAHGGTGLGLSIVKRIVEAHGGTVRALANEPCGTVFVVALPSAHARKIAEDASS